MTRRHTSLFALVLALLTGVALPAQGQATITVKMATLVPENSSWFLVLKEVANDWGKISNGKVRVLLYPGGRQGDDPDVVRKMNLGTLNAGVLTSAGLGEIERGVYALSIPMAFADYEEVYAVLEKMRPKLEAQFLAKGFVVLNWADGGWNHWFTKSAAATPDQMKKLKLFSWAGDMATTEAYKKMGFDPRPAPSTELVTGLQTGLFESFLAPPQVALITRYYEQTKYMTDMKVQILMGATIIRKETWERIPAELRPKLMASARTAGDKLQKSIKDGYQRDVDAMKKTGLTVVPVDAKTRELWRRSVEVGYPIIRGGVMPADAFDDALRYRDEYRRQKGAAKK
ncbi:MAG: TRAP transporter substrate-binding protein DctP [Gemmatimonadaceae bacterium]|nr:TRAP transporter substrate-binding protein DctP [Gemmatimonadaceae bacterium]